MIAWKLTTDFNDEIHLFSEKIKTDYVVEAYRCSCANTDVIIKYPAQELKYMCVECNNTTFYDANYASHRIENFLYQHRYVEFSFEYDMHYDETEIASCYVLNIPHKIDFLKKTIIFSKKDVNTVAITSNGKLKENYAFPSNKVVHKKLHENLMHFINSNGCFSIPFPNNQGQKLTLKMASFFLKNKHLKDFDFYYWNDINRLKDKDVDIKSALALISNNPKAKTVKKAIYQNYVEQLADGDNFDSIFIEVFSNNIKDINILLKLLKLNIEYSKYSNIDKENLDAMLCFLKQHYTEKQLLILFSNDEFHSNKYLFRDAVSEFSFNKDLLHEKFKKVPCKVQSLHDEFVRCSREERHKYIINQKLDYTKDETNVCVQTSGYQVKLPQTGKELYEWADRLHNCMAGYFEMIKEKENIIYGFFQEDILFFAVEISDNTIIQASEKHNANLSIENKQVLVKWFKKFFDQTFKLTSMARVNYAQ